LLLSSTKRQERGSGRSEVLKKRREGEAIVETLTLGFGGELGIGEGREEEVEEMVACKERRHSGHMENGLTRYSPKAREREM